MKSGRFDLTERFILHASGWFEFSIESIFFKLRVHNSSSKKDKSEYRSSLVEYLSKSATNYWLNLVAMSLREQTISYNINQILFHLTEVRYQPKFMKSFEFVNTCISNSSTKYQFFLRTMWTDFPAQLTVYIHPKTLRFLALFWMGRVLHIC